LIKKRKLSNRADLGHCHSQVEGTFFPGAVAEQRFYLLLIPSVKQDSLIFPAALTLHRAMLRSIQPLSIGVRKLTEHVRCEKSLLRQILQSHS
jgi:hypothetical protein